MEVTTSTKKILTITIDEDDAKGLIREINKVTAELCLKGPSLDCARLYALQLTLAEGLQ